MTPGSLSPSPLTLATLASLVIVSFVPTVRAQAPQERIEQSGCTSELESAVESALVVELSGASAEARAAFADGSARSAITCDDHGVIAVVSQGARRMQQRIDVTGLGAARRLAITLAELIEASVLSEPSDEPLAPPTSSRQPAAPTRAPLHVRLRASGGAWLGGEPLLALGTLDLGVELAPTSNIAIVLDASGALGATSTESAQLDARLLGAGLSLRAGGDVGAFWLGAGPAIRGGAVLWTGRPRDPSAIGHDATGAWLGLGAVAAAFARLGALPLRVGIEVEGGGIAYYSEALVLGAPAQRIAAGWLELRVALDVTLE